MAKLITPLSDMVPIVRKDGTPTPYFARILSEISDAKISASVIDAMGGDPDADMAVVWDDAAGDLVFLSLSDMLDWIDDTHGAVLYRDSAGWAALAPGTDGDVLTTHGSGADPTWETPSAGGGGPWTQVASTTIGAAVAQVDVTNLGGYSDLMVIGRALTASSAGFRIVQASVNNGSTFYSASGDYRGISSTGVESNTSDWGGNGASLTGATSFVLHILHNITGSIKTGFVQGNPPILFVASTNVVDALRIKNTAGNLTGGTITVLGRA